MPYVHLANGDVLQMDDGELAENNDISAPKTLHKDGKQHHIIGIYPDEVDLPKEKEKKSSKSKDDE